MRTTDKLREGNAPHPLLYDTSMTMKKRNKTWLIHSFSLLAVVLYAWLIQHYYGWQKMLAAWQEISPLKIMLSLLLMFFTYAVRAARIHDFFSPSKDYPLASCLKIMLTHNLLNNLMPMRTGEASFPLLMRKEFGTPIASATALLVMFRIMDFQILLMLGALSFLMFTGLHSQWLWVVPVLIIAPLAIFPLKTYLQSLSGRFTGYKFEQKIEQVLNILPTRFSTLLRMWLLSWLSWGTKIAVFTFIMLWFANIDPWSAMGATFAGELSAVIPIHTPGGLGTYEAGMVGIAAMLGLRGDWILFAGVQLHLLIIFSTLLSAVVGYFIPSRKLIETVVVADKY